MSTHDAEIDERNEHILIWVNGRLVPRAEASVSVYDSGFMLGDGVWEGLRLHDGRWGFLDDHLDRLFEAARAIDLDIGRDRAGGRGGAGGDARRQRHGNGRARAPHGHARPQGQAVPAPEALALRADHGDHHGALAAGAARWPGACASRRCRRCAACRMSQDPKLNSHSKLNCVLACIQAEKAGAEEALMLDPHGFVNTTNACNFFIVRKGEVWTSTGDYCMNGITRAKVLALCRANGIPAFERELQPRRRLRRRGSVPHRHLRRPDPGGRDRRPRASATAAPAR